MSLDAVQDHLSGGSGRTGCWRAATGAVFLLPFLFFLWRGWVPPRLKARLWLIFCGGAVLGRGRLVDGVVGPGGHGVSACRSTGWPST